MEPMCSEEQTFETTCLLYIPKVYIQEVADQKFALGGQYKHVDKH